MAYILILITLFFLGLKGVCGKKTSCLTTNTFDAALFNFIRMLLCCLIGFFVVLGEHALGMLAADYKMLLICLLAGISNAIFLVGWFLAVQKNTLVMVDVTLTMGSAIPAVLCAVLFQEPILSTKVFGFLLILLAAMILAGKEKITEQKSGLIGIVLMVLAMVGEGTNSFCQQLYKQFFTEGGLYAADLFYPKSIYHFYTYVFSGMILLLFMAVYRLVWGNKKEAERLVCDVGLVKKAAVPICIMAICMFTASWLQTMITGDYGMPSQILYPVIRGGSLIIINITAMIFFNEKITMRSVLGSLTALAGIIIMNG